MSGRDSPSSNQSGNLLTRMASWATYLESEPQHEPDLSIAKTLWLAHAEIERLTRLAEDGAMSARSLEAYQRRAEELRDIRTANETPEQHKVDPMKVTDEMVNRFLWWKLPRDFAPDCGISFDGRKPDQWNPSREWPMGTNLFTAVQARAMLEHVLGGRGTADAKVAAREAGIRTMEVPYDADE